MKHTYFKKGLPGFILIMLPLLLCMELVAQSYDVQFDWNKQSHLQAKLWTNEDGLPQGSINGFLEDHRGLIWLQVGGTLCTFDGSEIALKSQQDNLLYDSRYTMFAEDRAGNIWTYRFDEYVQGGLRLPNIEVYDQQLQRKIPLTSYIGGGNAQELSTQVRLFSLDQIVYISDPARGRLWSYNGVSLEVIFEAPEALRGKSLRYLPGPSSYFWALTLDSSGKHTQIYLLDEQGRVLYEHMLEHGMGHFLDRDRAIWVFGEPTKATNLGVAHPSTLPVPLDVPDLIAPEGDAGPWEGVIPQYYPIDKRAYAAFTSTSIREGVDYMELPSIWRTLGISRLAQRSYTYSWFSIDQIVSGSAPEIVPPDLFQVLSAQIPVLANRGGARYLLGTVLKDGSILFLIDNYILQLSIRPKYFKTYLSSYPVRGMASLGSNKLAVVQNQLIYSHLWEVDLASGSGKVVRKNKRENAYSVFREGDSIWVGLAHGGLELYDHQWQLRGQYLSPPEGRTYMETKSLYAATDSTRCYATNLGLVEVDLKTGSSTFLSDRTVLTHWIHQDAQKQHWIATDRGLLHWESQQFYVDSLPDGRNIPVSHLYEDEQGVFWLSTQRGLIRWRPFSESYTLYDQADGLSNNIIHTAYPDRYGRLWLSSNWGIMSFDTLNKTVNTYLEIDGLPDNEQNFQSHAQAEDGQLFFGGMKGVTAFYPDSIPLHRAPYPYSLSVDRLILSDMEGAVLDSLTFRQIDTAGLIRLPRANHQVRMEILFPYYQTRPVVIEWQLNGGTIWNNLDEEKVLFFANLPYGKSTLHLRAKANHQSSLLAEKTIYLYRPYPIFYEAWFWGLIILALIGLLVLFVRLRTRINKLQIIHLKKLVDEQTKSLRMKNQKLTHFDQTKNQLFKNISHELRTPLSLITLSSQDLLQKNLEPTAKKTAQRIVHQVGNLSAIVEDILTLGKIELGMQTVNKQAVEWNSFLSITFNIFESLTQKKQLTYELQILPNDPAYLLLDIAKTEQILNNLINNAIKYTPPGGRILVRSEQKADYLEISISDSGPGIPVDEQEAIFDRYYQAQHSAEHPNPGFGIGLAICKEYVFLLDGKIWVESKEGEGSTFFVQFPLELAPEATLLQSMAAEAKAEKTEARTLAHFLSKDKTQGKILLVEDHKALQEQVKQLLAEQYEVQTADNGQEAYDYLQEHPDLFDLVISDVMMPVVDGYSLLQKSRAHPELALMPFLFITALADEEDKLKALRLGVDAFITKPFSSAELLVQVKNLVKNQRTRKNQVKPAVKQKEAMATLPESDEKTESFENVWLRKVEEVIRSRFQDTGFKVTDIAFQLNISERTLRNRLKAYTGLTPNTYLKQIRLQYALLYLKNKKYKTISEVAYAVGFKDPGYFSKIFREAFGQPPSDYF
ncbi:MAG TPA: ATP-binding protein [Saprospiraceae bacterium]|nr:ATP-binding protein [Saprospiraceae bacterium]